MPIELHQHIAERTHRFEVRQLDVLPPLLGEPRHQLMCEAHDHARRVPAQDVAVGDGQLRVSAEMRITLDLLAERRTHELPRFRSAQRLDVELTHARAKRRRNVSRIVRRQQPDYVTCVEDQLG